MKYLLALFDFPATPDARARPTFGRYPPANTWPTRRAPVYFKYGANDEIARLNEPQARWLGPRLAQQFQCAVELRDDSGQAITRWRYNGVTGRSEEEAIPLSHSSPAEQESGEPLEVMSAK
jgi:hypothetical protein